jgi:hypothetical protein
LAGVHFLVSIRIARLDHLARREPEHSPARPKSHGELTVFKLSLEIIFGWSPFRIVVVILGSVLLSLAISIWFQSRDPTDLSIIQVVWGIASYVATAGSCKHNFLFLEFYCMLTMLVVAILLAILSSIDKWVRKSLESLGH